MRHAIAFTVVMLASSATAAPRCDVRVVKNVGAEDDPQYVLTKGSHEFGPVTQMRVDKKTGRMAFCAHGSFCYNSTAFDFTSPCRFTVDPYSHDDPDVFVFDAE